MLLINQLKCNIFIHPCNRKSTLSGCISIFSHIFHVPAIHLLRYDSWQYHYFWTILSLVSIYYIPGMMTFHRLIIVSSWLSDWSVIRSKNSKLVAGHMEGFVLLITVICHRLLDDTFLISNECIYEFMHISEALGHGIYGV